MLQGGNLIARFIMKKTHLLLIVSFLACTPALLAADLPSSVPSWHAQTLLAAIGNVLIFAAIGHRCGHSWFKVFDKCTPGHLEKEIIEHRNVAAAIVARRSSSGVSIIIAASMLG